MQTSVLYDRDGVAVVMLLERIVLAQRVRALSRESYAAFEAAVWRVVEGSSESDPAGVWVIVEVDAGLSDESALEPQRLMYERLALEKHAYIASMAIGASMDAIAIRNVGRAFMLGAPHMQMFADVFSAARWLAPSLRVSASLLVEAHRYTTALCEQSLRAKLL